MGWFIEEYNQALGGRTILEEPEYSRFKDWASELDDDLSNVGDDQYDYFLSEMGKVLDQFRRVLKPDRVAVIVIGDVMRKVNGITQLFPIHSDFIQLMKERGFVTWDIFIWETKIRKSGGKPLMGSYPYPHKLFSQFAHNYVLVFRRLRDPQRR